MATTAAVPSTPTPDSPSHMFPSSPSAYSLATPPESVRQYSNALKAFTRVGMNAAISDMQDDTRATERQFDVEFGYDDEDPIERHVRMYLTPNQSREETAAKKAIQRRKAQMSPLMEQQQMEDEDMLHVDVKMDTDEGSTSVAQLLGEQIAVDSVEPSPARAFRPGLIHFHRSSRGSVPSLTTSAPSFIRTDSSSSTPFGFDTDRMVRCSDDTPESTWSDASFEAIRTDDWASMYGAAGGAERKRQQSWQAESGDYFGTIKDRQSTSTIGDRTSVGSTDTMVDDMVPMAGSSKRPSLNRPRPRAFPQSIVAPEGIRSRENSGRTDLVADIRAYSPGPRSRQSSGDIYVSPTRSSRYRQYSDNIQLSSRLSGLSCRSKSSSDNGSHVSSLTGIGSGSRSRHPSEDMKFANTAHLELGPVPMNEEDDEWMSGRTISETMVVQAGFRSQKGRSGLRKER